MKTHALAGILVLALAALHAAAQDRGNQTQQGADASKTNPGSGQSAQNDAAEREQWKQYLKDEFNKDYPRAKKADERLDKARKKLDELGKFKEFVNADVLKQAQDEFAAAQKEYDSATAFLGITGRWLRMAPNDEAQVLMDKFDVAFKAFSDPSDRLKDYLIKREADLKKAGKTDDEILDDYIHDPKVKEMEKEIDYFFKAYEKAQPIFYKAYLEALKKAEQQGKLVIEDKTNDKFKASPTPNSNEPQGGLKLGGNSYVQPAEGTNSMGLKTTLPNWDFSGTGQVFTPTMPPIILPPYGSPGWNGSAPSFNIPGFQPVIPGGAALPQGSAGGCFCKPTCTCKPVCNCKK